MKKIVLLLSFVLFSFVIQAQQFQISSEVKEHIKERVDNGMNVSIAVGYIDGENVKFFSYGKSALENGFDVDENSVYEIGSISKVFTCILLAENVLDGKMKLSDPIENYLPEHVKVPSRNSKIITLKDLATHSSGLPRMPNNFAPSNPLNPYFDYTIDLAYDFMTGHELTRDIGSRFEYSNYGMGMLGNILELESGMSYEDLMVKRIADVLNMDDTRIIFTNSMKNYLARAHSNGKEVENWDLRALAGAGAIRSTTSDMVKFLKANITTNETLLNKAMKKSHQTAYKNVKQNFEMGLGWHYAIDKTVVWHNGGTGGYRAFAGFVEGTTKGVVVLTNSSQSVDDIGLKLLDDTRKLEMPKISIANALEKEINSNGITKALVFYSKAKIEDLGTYNFGEDELNRLGYDYLARDNMDIALVLFKLNVKMHPNASNPYDSLGEVYLKQGDSTLAVANYKKSLELNPGNDNAEKILNDLGVTNVIKDVIVSNDVLQSYVGKYQLSPNFNITVTKKDQQLFVQATGQNQFEVFASSQNEFYLKVVTASVTFNSDDKGKIISLTLHQGGQNTPGIKIE